MVLSNVCNLQSKMQCLKLIDLRLLTLICQCEAACIAMSVKTIYRYNHI